MCPYGGRAEPLLQADAPGLPEETHKDVYGYADSWGPAEWEGMHMGSKIFIAIAAAAVAVAFAPAVATASTAVPALHASDTQAYLLDANGNPITSTTTLTLRGTVTFEGSFQYSCDTHFTVDVFAGGTTSVKAPSSFTACTVNVPGCNISMVPNLDMGDRLVLDGNGDFRDRINFSYTNTFSGTCPYGPITYAGELSPILTFGGSGALEATFDGSAAGALSSALGSQIATGTLTEQGTLGNYGLGI